MPSQSVNRARRSAQTRAAAATGASSASAGSRPGVDAPSVAMLQTGELAAANAAELRRLSDVASQLKDKLAKVEKLHKEAVKEGSALKLELKAANAQIAELKAELQDMKRAKESVPQYELPEALKLLGQEDELPVGPDAPELPAPIAVEGGEKKEKKGEESEEESDDGSGNEGGDDDGIEELLANMPS